MKQDREPDRLNIFSNLNTWDKWILTHFRELAKNGKIHMKTGCFKQKVRAFNLESEKICQAVEKTVKSYLEEEDTIEKEKNLIASDTIYLKIREVYM